VGVGAGALLASGVLAAWIALQQPAPSTTSIPLNDAALPQLRPAPALIAPPEPEKLEPAPTELSTLEVKSQPKAAEPLAHRPRERKPRAESSDNATQTSKPAVREPAKPSPIAKPAGAPMLSASDLVQAAARELIQGHLAAAADLYGQAARLDPKSEPAYRGLGLTYERLGKKSEAIRALNRAVSLAPNGQNAAMLKARLEKLQSSQ
jgi:tetratricopeptide (TPR) repeat protein